jgi:peptidoglycan/LPS O-acetylase OafA/YrhL
MSPAKSDEKLDALDGLRAISILLVLAAHLLPLGPKAFRLNETAGAMGMSLFFALSGFLITSTLRRDPRVGQFLVRRLARILPLAYLYAAVTLLVFSFEPQALLWSGLFAINYLPHFLNAWTGHFWSLCVEMQFYLAVAGAVLLGGRNALWLVWLGCLTITLIRINAGAYIALETHLRVDEILSGACVATISPLRLELLSRRTSLILGMVLWAGSAWPSADAFQYLRPYTTAFLLLSALQYGEKNPDTLLGSRYLRYIAKISYALYVIHPATAHGWMSEGNAAYKYLLKRPISLALTFILAHLSTFYWESWWQSAARRWAGKRHVLSSDLPMTRPNPTK